MKQMTILNKTFDLASDRISIYDLKFLKENPRIYACTYGERDFDNRSDEEQQKIIYENLLKEPSVKNLIPEIQRHGGLMESILVRRDKMEVIEGNSRLAVFRKLHEDAKGTTDKWESIPCDVVASLEDHEQAALLNQIHVKGKTQWSAYEQANFAYVRKQRGHAIPDIAELFGESSLIIQRRVNAIAMMHGNNDSEQSHFSHYYVLLNRPKEIEILKKADGWEKLMEDIKRLGSDEQGVESDKPGDIFTAQDLRKMLPVVLKKPKVLKKYVARDIGLGDAYQLAKISTVEGNVRKATDLLKEVEVDEIETLGHNRFNAFKQSVRKLVQETTRIKDMTEKVDN